MESKYLKLLEERKESITVAMKSSFCIPFVKMTLQHELQGIDFAIDNFKRIFIDGK